MTQKSDMAQFGLAFYENKAYATDVKWCIIGYNMCCHSFVSVSVILSCEKDLL